MESKIITQLGQILGLDFLLTKHVFIQRLQQLHGSTNHAII